MFGSRHAGTVRPMLTSFSPTTASASELRYAATQLHSSARLLQEVQANIPGPETRSGFSGVMRVAFEAFVAARVTRIDDAAYECEVAALAFETLAARAENAVSESGR